MDSEKKIIGRCPFCGGNVVKTCKGYRCENNTGEHPSCVLNINAIIGKVVTLKSASDVKMTAAKMADDGGVLCVWMHDGVVQSASIPLAALDDYRKVQMEML